VLGAVALCLAVTPTAGAIGPFGVAHTVLAPSCHPDTINGDLVQDTGGRSRGFVNLYGSTCNPSQVITYVSGVNGAWSRQTTPYRGFPVATAWDSTGSFLLYVSYPSLRLYVTKRYADGTFAAARLLSSNVGPDGSLLTGDIVAAHGSGGLSGVSTSRPTARQATSSHKPTCSRPTPSAARSTAAAASPAIRRGTALPPSP